MEEGMLLVAIGCGCIPGIFKISARHSFVIFGTMDDNVFADFTADAEGTRVSALPVYFYETG